MMLSLNTPKEALIQVATLMRQRRLDRNITQAQLAKRSGVSLATLRKFERTGKISLESFLKLAFVLDVMDAILNVLKIKNETFSSMDELLQGKDKTIKKRARAHAK